MPTKTVNNTVPWTAKDVYDMLFSKYGNAHAKANAARAKEASKYTIPYIPEKEIMLTTGRYNTGKISTNLLDSIYDASKRTNIPLDIALGLAGRESTLGIGRGFKKGKSVTATDLYSNWQQIQPVPNNVSQMNKWNDLLKKSKSELTDEDYDFKSDFIMRSQNALESTKQLSEHPIDNALRFYQSGKYNPGDKRHTEMVEEDGRILMSDPAIQKWLATKNNNQMKCGGRRKARLGLDIREGGIAIPISKDMYYMQGRKHNNGGIAIGPNNKNGLEVEGGEVVKVNKDNIKVFSSVPFLRGVSPAQLVLGGSNPSKVFEAQEKYKDKNRLNDDGSKYENGGEKIYTPSKRIQREIQETGKITIGGYPTIGGSRTFGYLRKLATVAKYGNKGSMIFQAGRQAIKKGTQQLVEKGVISKDIAQIPRTVYGHFVGGYGQNLPKTIGLLTDNREEKKSGGIYIKPSKRGTFTAAASKHNMGVQEFASKVLANKEDYSPAMVKKANFARNASRWKKEYGGDNVLPELIVTPTSKYNKVYDASGANKRRKIADDILSILPFSGFVKDVIGLTNPINAGGAIKSAAGYGMARAGLPFLSLPGITYNGVLGLPDFIMDVQQLYKDIKTPKEEFNKNKKEYGGMVYTINGNVKNGLMSVRPKAELGTEKKFPNEDKYGRYYVTKDGYRIYENGNVITPKGNSKYYRLMDAKSGRYTGELYTDKNGNREIKQSYATEEAEQTYNASKNKRPQYYTEKGIPLYGSKSVAEKAGLARSGWSYADDKEIDVDTNILEKYGIGSPLTTPRKGSSKSAPTKATASKAATTSKTPPPTPVYKRESLTEIGIKNNAIKETPATVGKTKAPAVPSPTGGQNERWVGQYNPTTTGDWIGLGANVIGSLASFIGTNKMLKNMPMPSKPVAAPIMKLKTRFNINAPLTEIGEEAQRQRDLITRNTASSNTSLARQQRVMNEAQRGRNQLYTQKENIETQLINQDRLNRQSMMARNVAAYNTWLDKLASAKTSQAMMKANNFNNLISGLTGGVGDMLSRIETRRTTNNTIQAMAAANPNVDARLIGNFDFYKAYDRKTGKYLGKRKYND